MPIKVSFGVPLCSVGSHHAEQEGRREEAAGGAARASFWPDEIEALEREAKEKRVSEAEVLRRALRANLNL